ncbi:MAG: hypothetical protein AAGF85_02625 [Bacteroidota bacterium]
MISKFYLTIFLFVMSVCLTKAQELPKEGVALDLSQTSFNVTPGSTTDVEIKLLRSKRARKMKFDGLEARTSNDLAITFRQNDQLVDTYTMSIIVKEGAIEKSHTIVIKGAGINGSKIKGKAISIVVTGSQIVKSN